MAAEKGIFDLESEKDDQKWKPKCIDYWSKWRACVASSNQFHKYYQYGKFDDCEVHQQDLKKCFLWKTGKSVDALDHLISRRQEELRKESRKFAHSVWERREDPSKDWNHEGF